MIKFIQTSLIFDANALQNEFKLLQNDNWSAHYNKSHYEGDWTILPFRSINGSLDNVIATHNLPKGLSYQNTVLLDKCPYIQSVINTFECEKTSIRLMKLNAGALIKEHRDQDMNMEAGEARFHIPVQTNKDVAFFIQEDRIPMLAGECWYLNLSLPHRVHNASDEDRIHLVMDCIVNDWVKSLLSEPGITRKDIDAMPEATIGTVDKVKIIEELRRQNTATALELADKLETESN